MSDSTSYPDAVIELIEQLRRLPGVGRRGAERMALALLKFSTEDLQFLGNTISELPAAVAGCEIWAI